VLSPRQGARRTPTNTILLGMIVALLVVLVVQLF
jgi:hypothetical protein